VGQARRLGQGLRAVRDHLDIDPHGRVIPEGDEVRRLLADRAGRFTLLPSVPDLLVARRTPVSGGAAPPARCILAGDLAAFPIADFVAFVHQSRLSGVLTVCAGQLERALVFQHGEVRGARSEGAGERIGEVALRLGYVDARQLELAVAAARPIGKALIEKGFLSPADLWKCIHEQVAVVFHAVLLAHEGVFTMVEEPGGDLGTALSMNTQSLLMDGIRRIDEMALFRARIPGAGAYLRRRQPTVPTALDAREDEVLALVDGRRRVGEIAQLLHLDEFDATKVMYHLAEAGYVEAMTDPMAAPDPSQSRRAETLVSAMNDILRLVMTEVVTAGAAEAFAAGVRAFLSDGASRHAPLWQRVVARKDGSVDPGSLLETLAVAGAAARHGSDDSGEPARHLFDGLRELMFFYLFQAGELLPRATDERLNREVKRRFEALGDLR
jgi:hypothetical protein